MSISESEVEKFLKEFGIKMKIFSIFFRDERPKNLQTLLDLEITKNERRRIIENLQIANYVEGPLNDDLYGIASMWVFGSKLKETEIYIKISLGKPNQRVICISFHTAKYPLNYPFKTKQE